MAHFGPALPEDCSGPDGVRIPLPTVQLIGAQKAGTSAIADWLFDHGGFARPLTFDNEPWYFSKEVHFFDIDSRYQQGPTFYSERFRHSKKPTLDATPDTLQFAPRVRMTYEHAGGNQVSTVRIMVILRDPVARELSLYNHLAHDCRTLPEEERNSWHNQVLGDDGRTILSFDDFVQQRSRPALQNTSDGRSTRHSLYAQHLSAWFTHFSRSQILVLSYEELVQNPARLQQRICSFLGGKVPIHPLPRSNTNDSEHKIRKPSRFAQNALRRMFEQENERLYILLGEVKPRPPMEQYPFPTFP